MLYNTPNYISISIKQFQGGGEAMTAKTKNRKDKDIDNRENILVKVDRDLKDRFRIALIYERTTITQKLNELIEQYTESVFEEIVKSMDSEGSKDKAT